MMKRRGKRAGGEFHEICTGAGVIFLVTVIFLCTILTVKGQAGELPVQKEEYYQEKEEIFCRRVRNYLDQNGFSNSGIMLTRVVNQDESRVYTLTIHHDRIDSMGEEDREQLARQLLELAFKEEGIRFRSEFLIR